MTDYYTSFCLKIDNVSEAGKAWAEEQDEPVKVERHGNTWTIILDSDMLDSDVDVATSYIQEYLLKFDPTRVVGFEWAYGCSRSLPDAFGGGAAVVTAVSIEVIDTTQLLARMEEAAKLALDNRF